MNSKKKISQLPREEQLRLIERLVRRLREGTTNSNSAKEKSFEDQLVAMANDHAMQAELRQIDSQLGQV